MIETSAKLNATLTHVFEYRDLERLVFELYGQKIEILNGEQFIPDERVGHYTYHEWTVDGDSELSSVGDKEIVAKWIETGQTTGLDMTDVPEYDWANAADIGLEHIMHRLFIEGHIPVGNYLMKVDW